MVVLPAPVVPMMMAITIPFREACGQT